MICTMPNNVMHMLDNDNVKLSLVALQVMFVLYQGKVLLTCNNHLCKNIQY